VVGPTVIGASHPCPVSPSEDRFVYLEAIGASQSAKMIG